MDITLLVFHSLTSYGKECIDSFNKKLQDINKKKFKICFLNGNPSLRQTLLKCKEEKATKLNIIPMLLLPGVHLNKDIPEIINEFSSENAKIEVSIQNCLSIDDNFIEYISNRI